MIVPTAPVNAAAHGLRDIHLPPAPPWWPPAPGWWVLAACASILLARLCVRGLHRAQQRRRVRTVLREFDRAVDAAPSQSASLAAASALLRRAARLHDPAALQMCGDAWLAYLDGTNPARPFSRGEGRALTDGMFNRIADATQATAALRIARDRLRELLMSAPLGQPDA
jgi:hypothetical protein